MTTITPAARRSGQPVEQARYPTDEGQRVLIAKRCSGKVALFDLPATGRHPRFIIEPVIQSLAELDALVADYLNVARRRRWCPMQYGTF